MRELFEQLRMYSWMVLHHRWSALIGAVMFCSIGWGGLMLVKDQYKVQAKVYLDTKVALRPLIEGTREGEGWNPQQSAMLVKRTLLTRANIEEVIGVAGLGAKIENQRDHDKIVKWLATDIRVERVLPAIDEDMSSREEGADIYSISFQSDKAELAMKIVETVLKQFVESLSAMTRTGAQEAGQFLEEEIAAYAQKLTEAEDRLKQFKIDHPDVLLGRDGQSYSERVEALQRQLETARLGLREAEYRAEALRGQIATLTAMRVTTTSGGGPAASPLDARIEALESRLNELLTNYTEQHPEVVGIRRTLKELQDQKSKGLDRSTRGGSTTVIGTGVDTAGPRLMLADAEARAAALKEQIRIQERQLEELKPLAGTMPKVEAELAQLNRDYDVIRATYERLVQRREQIKLAEGAQTAGGDSMFKVIEAPRIPALPIWPPRILLVSAIFCAALGLGVAMAWLRAQSRPTFYTRSQLESVSGVPVLGSVTMTWSVMEIARRQLGMFIFGLLVLGLVAAYVAMLQHYGYEFKLDALKDVGESLGVIKP